MRYTRVRWRLPVLMAVALALIFGGRALAAEVYGGDRFYLAAGEVLEDDLYISAQEIVIDGTVAGDVIAAGGLMAVNAVVTGDLIAAGGSVVVAGTVEDDVRVAGGAVDVNGAIGGDLVAAGGGGDWSMPMTIGGRQVAPGIRMTDSARIGGDAYIAGGEGRVAGTIGRDLRAAVGALVLEAEVGRDAGLAGQNLRVLEGAQIDGTLRYTTPEQQRIPAGVAEEIVYVAPETDETDTAPGPAALVGWGLVRTLLVLIGFALLAWVTLRFAPQSVMRPAVALERQPGRSALYGLLAALLLMVVPLASALLVFLMVVFFGWLAGVVTALLLFGSLALLWVLSPLVVGTWLGQRLAATRDRPRGALPWLVAGVLIVALLTRIPVLGWLVALVSFILALGGILLAWRTRAEPAYRTTAAE